MSAPATVSAETWRAARRALVAMTVVLVALIAALVTVLVVRPGTAAPAQQPASSLHTVTDTCLGARPGSPC